MIFILNWMCKFQDKIKFMQSIFFILPDAKIININKISMN